MAQFVYQCAAHHKTSGDDPHRESCTKRLDGHHLPCGEAIVNTYELVGDSEVSRELAFEWTARIVRLTEERDQARGQVFDLTADLGEAREALAATQRAKAENDERFLVERDEARAEAARNRKALRSVHLIVTRRVTPALDQIDKVRAITRAALSTEDPDA
jgi:hypothetical protein